MAVNPIKIAILAMGGEGGGVLADWLVDLGEHNGYIAQATSVPGVAQRTGATIYYVELFPRERAEQDGQQPVLALMPLPGDVDIVLASELMEAGRAVQRGLVTPDRTTLIASTHRVYSMIEKTAMGDGRIDSQQLIEGITPTAKRFVRFDMAEAADQTGSVISAVLFGALAATGALPFSRNQFEATIERGGVGVKSSLRAFGHAFDQAGRTEDSVAEAPGTPTATTQPKNRKMAALLQRVNLEFPESIRHFLIEGVRRTVDFQDPAYAGLYLDRMARICTVPGAANHPLARETARHLALWMTFEDTIRVADLKIRDSRFDRVRSEVKLQPNQVLTVSEFMHPRVEEIAESIPAPLGRWLLRPSLVNRLARRLTRKGRVVTTSSLSGYMLLWLTSRGRLWRRSTLRYRAETERIEDWLTRIEATAARNPDLALEIAKCQRLVKGYSDTHARGLNNYQTLMQAIDRAGATLAPATLNELCNAALADEHGKQLRVALARHSLA